VVAVTRVEKISDGVVLCLGDCRDILSGVPADALITDPVWRNVPAGLLVGAERPYDLFREMCERIPAGLKRLAIEMRNDSDPRFLAPIPARFDFVQVMWCQYAMPGYLGRVLGGNETVYVYGEPIQSGPGRRVIPSVSPKAQPRDRPNNGHPCSRTLPHQMFVVNWCSDEGEVVVDPFMGSGTTGEACVALDRSFVGIEIEPKYFDIARRRLSAALERPRLPFVRTRAAEAEAML
jgi:hypothetical protein